MLKKLQKISSKTVLTNNFWDYNCDYYKLPNGKLGEYHYVHSRGSTFVIPKLNNDIFVMVRQYRYLNSKESLEFPGGGMKKNILPEQNAAEELKEETGYIANKLKQIGQFNPFNGVTDEICRIFLAEELQLSVPEPEDAEEFDILLLSSDDIIEKISSGEIWDGMTLAAWSVYYFNYWKKLL